MMIEDSPSMDMKVHKPIKKKPLIKVRWIICAISFLLAYSLVATKVSLSLAIVAMTDDDPEGLQGNAATSLLNETSLGNTSIVLKEKIHRKHHINWTQSTNDQLLEAAFVGALFSPIPSGRISEKFGPRKIAFILGLICGASMLLFPIAAEAAFEAAFAIRVVQGLCIGCVFPCTHVLITRWVPKYEKTLFAAVVNAGAMLGVVSTHPVVGLLSSSNFLGGWPSVFYVIGLLNIIVAFAWLFVVHDNPEDHPFISDQEKEEILEGRTATSDNPDVSIPWASLLSSAPVWALILSNFAYGWFTGLISGQVPSFLNSVLNVSIESNGLLSALPYVAAIFSSLFFSYLADKLRANGKYSTTAIRKFAADFGFILSSVFLVLSTFTKNPVLVVTCIVVSKALAASQLAGCYAMHLDISPTYAGSLVGLMETAQNLASIAMNSVAAYIVGDEPTLDLWGNFFLVTAGLNIFGTHYFALLGSAKLQKWDPTFKSDEQALEDDRNGDNVSLTIYDPEIIRRPSTWSRAASTPSRVTSTRSQSQKS